MQISWGYSNQLIAWLWTMVTRPVFFKDSPVFEPFVLHPIQLSLKHVEAEKFHNFAHLLCWLAKQQYFSSKLPYFQAYRLLWQSCNKDFMFDELQ